MKSKSVEMANERTVRLSIQTAISFIRNFRLSFTKSYFSLYNFHLHTKEDLQSNNDKNNILWKRALQNEYNK